MENYYSFLNDNNDDLNNQNIMSFTEDKQNWYDIIKTFDKGSDINRTTNEREENNEQQNKNNYIINSNFIINENINDENGNNEEEKSPFFACAIQNEIQNENNINQQYIDNSEMEQTLLSKKKERTKKKHSTKYDDDYMRRRCKHIVLDNLNEFINKQIRIAFNNNIGKGICIKQLQNLNQKQKSEPNIEFNKRFLNKTIKEIFSEKISGRFTNFPPNHNFNLINQLLKDDNPNIKAYFSNLFSLTFIQCLGHFRGTEFHNELIGMKVLKDECELIDDEDYVKNLEYYFNNYEMIINNKKSRKSKKKMIQNNL